MNPTKREISRIELRAQWTRAHRAWEVYDKAEETLDSIPQARDYQDKRRAAVIQWAAVLDTYRNEYRELKHLMRIAIQYKRL